MRRKQQAVAIRIDKELAFMLYVVGFNESELAARMNVSQQRVSQIALANNWQEKREMVRMERAKRIGVSAAAEQAFIRAQESDLARHLMVTGHEMLRAYTVRKDVCAGDICRVLDLASRLGRLGAGLPLVPIELSVTHDLTEEMEAALDRAFPEPAKAIEAQVIEQKPSETPGCAATPPAHGAPPR